MQIMPPPAAIQSAADPRFQDRSPQATGVNHSVTEQETRSAVAPTAEGTASASARDAASQKNQQEHQPTKEELDKAMDRLNHTVGLFDMGVVFTTDRTHDDVRVVQVINRDTKEVIRQIPSEEAIRIAKAFDSFLGLLIREEV